MFIKQQLTVPLPHIKELNDFFDIKDHLLSVQDNNARKLMNLSHNNWPKHCVELLFHQMKVQLNKDYMIKIDETSKKSAQPPHADKGPGWHTVVIPLKWYPPVYSILFDQYYHGTYFRGYKYRPTGKQEYEKEWLSTDHDMVHDLVDTPFDQNNYQKYLYGTCDIEDLHGLTVQSVQQWHPGCGIRFPANQIHSGSLYQVVKRMMVIHWEE